MLAMQEVLRDEVAPELRRKRRPLKRAGEGVAGVLAVLAGLKPSYLYDIGHVADPAALARAVAGIHRLAAAGAAADAAPDATGAGAVDTADPCVVVLQDLGDDGGPAAAPHTTASSSTWRGLARPVRISTLNPGRSIPPPLNVAATVAVFVADRPALRAALREARPPSTAASGAATTAGISTPLVDVRSSDRATGCFDQPGPSERDRVGLIATAIADALEPPGVGVGGGGGRPGLVTIAGRSDWPFVALFGLLLGYPVAYCNTDTDTDTDPGGTADAAADGGNCLGGQDLSLYKLRARCTLDDSSGGGGAPRELVSFTVPTVLAPGLAGPVAAAVARWRRRAEAGGDTLQQRLFTDITVSVEHVNHPAVAL